MVRYKTTESGPIAGINITPFTDVILVLLIVFMISAPSLYMSSFKIQLPSSQSQVVSESNFRLIVGLDQEGTLFISGMSFNDDQLKEKLLSLEPSKKDRVLLNADERLQHGRVVQVVDILRQSGAGSVSVGTVPK